VSAPLRAGFATVADHDNHDDNDTTTTSILPTTSMNDLLFNPTPEHAALRSVLQDFVADRVEPQAIAYNEREEFNIDLFGELAGLGVVGLTVPEQYGGSGLGDATAVAILHEELSYSDPAFCLSYLAHSLLLTHNLAINGNDAQRQKYLPACSTAELIGGMAMSEPNAGTDVLGMQTTATPDNEQHPTQWTLQGTKLWITNGTLDGQTTGGLFLVYAKTGPQRTDVTLFLVEKDTPGFSLGQQIKQKLGMRASPTAELVLDNVVVPHANVVGPVNGATLCMMRNLEIERLGLAAMAIGIARRCLDDMKAYAGDRAAFGQRNLYRFGQVQQLLAESYANYRAGKAYVYGTARALDLHSTGNTLDADGVKLYSATMAKQVADAAIQVLGGNGYVGEYNVERLWRDAKLLEIGGGTNQSHHKNMARDLEKMGAATKLE